MRGHTHKCKNTAKSPEAKQVLLQSSKEENELQDLQASAASAFFLEFLIAGQFQVL